MAWAWHTETSRNNRLVEKKAVHADLFCIVKFLWSTLRKPIRHYRSPSEAEVLGSAGWVSSKLLRISQAFQIMRQIRSIEVLLIEVIFYLALWLFNDYVAMYLSLIFGSIFFFILLFTGIAELIERSKVSRKYFWFMAMSALAPLLAAAIFFLLGGEMTWNKM